MTQYVDKSVVKAEIERWRDGIRKGILSIPLTGSDRAYATFEYEILGKVRDFLDTLEVKEVDLDKLGEITRHLIAVKEHIEDMRLDKEEWLILEKIGYPERFIVQKGE